MGVRIHHFFSNKLTLEFFAPEYSVPAIGCPGIKLHFSFAKFIVFLLKHFFTDPTSVIIVSLFVIKGKISATNESILLTGVHIKIIWLFEILSSILCLFSSIAFTFCASIRLDFELSIPTILLEIFFFFKS